MKKLAAIIALFATIGATASEVGTQNPIDVEITKNNLALATADKGAGDPWTEEPLEFMATAHQTAKLNKQLKALEMNLSIRLDDKISEKLNVATEL
jgi:hypothetical protein